MKYIRIPYLINTYPQTTNYVSVRDNVTLFGRYYDINKIDFSIPSLSSIKVVDGTRFRNIIAIYKDQQDSSPKYYTSEFYSRDLEASKIESNPYFINESINLSTIVKIYIKDIIGSLETLIEEETKLDVKFIRNNFILFDESGLVKENELQSSENNNSTNANRFGLFKPGLKLKPSKIDNQVKKVLDKVIGAKDESDIIEVDGKYIDCIYLIKYIDWMFSKPTFEEVETGNVIPAEKLSVFKTKDTVQTEDTQNQNGNQPTSGERKYFTYEIIRLSIPASIEQSVMTYRDQFGQTQEIRVDKYGFIREICAEENSWGGAFNLFQRTQLEPCNIQSSNPPQNTGQIYGGGGGRSGGDFIDYNRDRDFIDRGEAARQNIQ